MIILYTAVMLFGGFLLGKYIRERAWKMAFAVAATALIFGFILQVGVDYVVSHPGYRYGGLYYSRY